MNFNAACQRTLDLLLPHHIARSFSSQIRRGVIAIRAKGPQLTEALSAVPALQKRLAEQTSKADKLFIEVGEMKVGLAERDRDRVTSLRPEEGEEKSRDS